MMQFRKTILLLALAFSSLSGTFATANSYRINPQYPLHFINNEAYTFNGGMYTFVSHVVGGWDTQKVTYPGVQNLLAFSRKHIITSFGVVSRYGGDEMQFFKPGEVSFVLESDAGQHRFKFTTARSFLVGGGNLSLCLCELLRDLVRSAEVLPSQPLNLFLVSDAIYDDRSSLTIRDDSLGYPKFTLSQFAKLHSVKDIDLEKYIEQYVVGEQGVFCPGQNYFSFPQVDKSKLLFQIYRDRKLIGSVGPNRGIKVNLIVTESSNLERMIPAFGADKAYPSEFP